MGRSLDLKFFTWNCEGLDSKKQEVDKLIGDLDPFGFCLQDTRLTKAREKFYQFAGYQSYFKSIGPTASGVALYIKKNIPQSEVIIRSNLQVVAARATLKGKTYILSSLYVPPSTQPTVADFDHLFTQFQLPYLLNCDSNAHSSYWNSPHTTPRGRTFEEVIDKHHLLPLNITQMTHWNRAHNTYSLIDLSLSHPAIFLDFQCEVLPDLHTSDHYPILIKLGNTAASTQPSRFNFKKANWSSLKADCLQYITPALFEGGGADKMEVFTSKLIELAKKNIPQTSRLSRPCPKPWWDEECKALVRERNKAERINQRYPTLTNKMRVKVIQAQCRRKFRRKKRQSFRNFTSSINSKVHSKKVWNMVQKLTGKKVPSHLNHLKDEQGNFITDSKGISNKFGEAFSHNSSSNNYSQDFRDNVKNQQESTPIDFSDNTYHRYNKKFKLRDLKRSIKRAKASAPGPDEVHYLILKNLPNETLIILLDLINEYWESHNFPPSWKEALVIPLPKEGKDHNYANSYRPIALTSCICKTVERMVNERLVFHLDRNKILTKFQCGFRNDKSTLDQLVRLETYIRDAFASDEHVVAVFFDLHKAYDTAWKHGILKDLYDMGLRGNLPIFIQNFLSDRIFSVVYANILSDSFTQEEGVPQGAILSTTLFNIKLNDIVKEVLPGVECSLYVDDFVLMFRSKSMCTIERKMKSCIQKVKAWTFKNGFTISEGEDKTVGMHFCRKQCCPDPELKLDYSSPDTLPIPFKQKHKFLGLIWDTKLSFREHVKYLKKKCQNSLNLLKILSHTDWGSDTKCLLKLYRALVRSKLDYGSIVYRNAAPTDLQPLNVIHNQGLRLALGAFKSSPVESLYVEANELPLHERRIELAMKYGLKIRGNPQNPAFHSVFNLQFRDKYNSSRKQNSLALDLDILFNEANIDVSQIKTNFVPTTPACYSKSIETDLSLAEFPKETTPPSVFVAKFNELKATKYPHHQPFYSDGSKLEERTSFAVKHDYGVVAQRIADHSSIFTAEAEGIRLSLRFILVSPWQFGRFVIFSDSKSVIESLDNYNSTNVVIKEILDLIYCIHQKKKSVVFCWVPGHVGIRGNELADQAAKRALNRRVSPAFRLPYQDLFPVVRAFVKQRWQNRWDSAHATKPIKLHAIQPIISPFHLTGLTRKEETVIHRLRIGHTRLTHAYLFEQRGPIKYAPLCHFCEDPFENLTVEHILIDCHELRHVRRRYYLSPNLQFLFENIPVRNILDFLKEIHVFREL